MLENDGQIRHQASPQWHSDFVPGGEERSRVTHSERSVFNDNLVL